MQPLLSIQNLSVDFISEKQITRAVRNVSFDVHRGEILAIVGESGSGKSVTSLSILQLLASPPAKYTGGPVIFSNNHESFDLLSVNDKTLRKIRGNYISMIFQEPMTSLNPVMTCGKQVAEVLLTHQKSNEKQVRAKVIEWFTRVKLPDPENIYDRYPHQLSGGQKQRVMIAMAMCCEPSLLICDEPTTALDVTVQKTILELIRELRDQTGMGVIFITHDLGVVAEIADRAIVMFKGEVVETGTRQQIFYHPQHSYTKALLACRPANHTRGERLPVVSDFMGSREKPTATITAIAIKPASDEVLMKIENLSVHFAAKHGLFAAKSGKVIKAVDDLSFDIYKGETLGLVGESGCGKTTLGRTLLRLIKPTSGRINYHERDLAHIPNEEMRRLRKDVQIIFQDPYSALNPRITIDDAISEPLKVHGIIQSEKGRREKVKELLEKVNLDASHAKRYPHEFSGGQRQRIVIARALALNPSFIVCDESVSALDVSVQAQVLNLLNDLKKEFGFTIVFISHDLSVVRYLSDRIMVMNKGKIVEIGDADEVYHRPASSYTKKLIDSIPRIADAPAG